MTQTITIEAGRSGVRYWRDLWDYRELLGFLTWRDILVRYKQTAFGVAWAVIRPFLTMVVFTVVFGKLAGLPSDGAAPYALMVFAALLPWQLFATAVGQASESLVGNQHLVSKIYFPRLILPLSSVATALVDSLIALVILFGMMAFYQFAPDWRIVFLPAFMALGVANVLGVGLFVAALNVHYRDFRYVVPFALQLGMYASPVGFSSAIIPEGWRLIYSLNPMVGVIDGYRWCLLGGDAALYWPGLAASVVVSAAALALGLAVFRATEATFADRI
jgi:lipopolysaccharide transport system permease protein